MRLWVVVLAVACAADGDDDTGTCTDDTIAITDAHHQRVSAALTLDAVEVAEGADLTVCWDALTHDALGRPVDDLGSVVLTRYLGTPEDLAEGFADDRLLGRDFVEWWTAPTPPDGTCLRLSELEILGIPFEPHALTEDTDGTWVLALTRTGWLGRDEVVTAVVLDPRADASVDQVALADGMATGQVDADLGAGVAVDACGGADRVDWSGLTVDAGGSPWDAGLFDTLVLVHADAPPAAVEADPVGLTRTARTWWVDAYKATDAPLVDGDGVPTAADGSPFPGLTADGTWLVAVVCSTCWSPLPGFVGVLDTR